MLASEGVGLRLYLRLFLWRGGLRMVDSEEVSKTLSKKEVVRLETVFEGRRGGYLREIVVESMSLK